MRRPVGDEIEFDVADDNEDGYESDEFIDPLLRSESQQQQNKLRGSVPLMSPISLTRPRPIVNTAQPFVPSTTAASRAPSATPSRPFLTGGRGTLATPASNVFKPTQPRRQPVQPSTIYQATANESFQTPDLPLARKAGFSTASESVKHYPGGPPKHASSNTAARAPSTAFSDKLANLDAMVQSLVSNMERLFVQSRTSAGLETQIHSLVEQNEVLRETVEEQRAEIDELKNTVNAQSTSLDELLTLIKDRRTMDNLGPSTKSVDKATKAVRDNVFNVSNPSTSSSILCTHYSFRLLLDIHFCMPWVFQIQNRLQHWHHSRKVPSG
jgi:hypothetical protein